MGVSDRSGNCNSIYYKELLDGSPPTQLSDLVSLNEKIKEEHPGVATILWDYDDSYYSWGILASAGAYDLAKHGHRLRYEEYAALEIAERR